MFVPPDRVLNTFGELENYIAEIANQDLPLLIKIALVHYQFETIHPFHDGNGRVGRLLIPLLLYGAGALPFPMLYMSPFFERNKNEYIDRLYEVSRLGLWEHWITFFLQGVAEQASDTISKMHKVTDLQAEYREKLSQARNSALLLQLVDFVCEFPVVSTPRVAEHLGITYASAKNNIEKLVNAGILSELRDDIRPRLFIAHDIYGLITGTSA